MNNLKLQIYQEDHPESPFDCCDQIFSITYSKQSNYILGNEPIGDVEGWLIAKIWEADPDADRDPTNENLTAFDPLNATLDELREKFAEYYYFWEVYAYIHGAATIRIDSSPMGCTWDSGMSGIVYAEKSELAHCTQEQAHAQAKGVVETFDDYLNHRVYCYNIRNEDDEIIGCCGGFYGDDHNTNNLIDHARETLCEGERFESIHVLQAEERTVTTYVITEDLTDRLNA